ncbi:hypothetical protein MLD38_031088 [Melastoma candidum]|uniref:Uncharacterized protein n=1 Tax=Melastoma candidum TaxID=119954 RepID=A0ACB9MQL2_9MYRT|nr:hypothetical protein MLD38_031088 [Melastoma candidum]
MRAKLVVFPVKGRYWCFTRSSGKSTVDYGPSRSPSTVKDLWDRLSSRDPKEGSNLEVVVDFLSSKMNKAWTGLETAPQGSFKSKLHGLGLRLLARVKPSEIFLKSITKDISRVEVTYPSSLNARLVRRRLRHIALRGSIIHRNYLYGSVTLLPITVAFAVLPLPNIPFFWVSFRVYSNWRALKGSEKLLELVSDTSVVQDDPAHTSDHSIPDKLKDDSHNSLESRWVLQPSEQLEELIRCGKAEDGLNESTITDICKMFELNTIDVIKYRDTI